MKKKYSRKVVDHLRAFKADRPETEIHKEEEPESLFAWDEVSTVL